MPFNLCLSFFLLLSANPLLALEHSFSDYGIERIDHALRQEARVVVRKDVTSLSIKSTSHALLEVDKVITIMNPDGQTAAPIYLFYDQHRRINNLSARIFDKDGKLLHETGLEDFEDYPAVAGLDACSDCRFKVFSQEAPSYPYTIAYNYSVEIDGLYRYPTWSPMKIEGTAVEQASFSLSIPKNLGFQRSVYQLDRAIKKSTQDSYDHYLWEVSNLKPVFVEPSGPEFYQITPTLQLFPLQFSYQGVAGNAASWESFGTWVDQLLKRAGSVPLATAQEVHELTSQVKELQQKVEVVKQYVLNRFQYVSLPLGLGTYQPINPLQLEETGAGDSKALAHYTQSLLHSLRIRSHYALVNAGKYATDIDPTVAGAQFNRAILAVPLAHDTLWIDFSDSERPASYRGYALEGKDVLLIKESGGELVSIPESSAEQNLQSRNATVHLLEGGSALAEVSTRFTGLQYAHLSPLFMLAPNQQEEVIYRKTPSDLSFTLEAFSYHKLPGKRAILEEKLQVSLEEFAKRSGDLMFFNPNLLNQMDGLPPAIAERQHGLKVKRAFLDTDALVYHLPDNVEVRRLPENVHLETEFGEYRTTSQAEGERFIYTRYFKTKKGEFDARAYARMQAFYEDIVRYDQRKVVLQMKEAKGKKEGNVEVSSTER